MQVRKAFRVFRGSAVTLGPRGTLAVKGPRVIWGLRGRREIPVLLARQDLKGILDLRVPEVFQESLVPLAQLVQWDHRV